MLLLVELIEQGSHLFGFGEDIFMCGCFGVHALSVSSLEALFSSEWWDCSLVCHWVLMSQW